MKNDRGLRWVFLSAAASSIASVATLSIAVIRVKATALSAGAAGVGVVAQLTALSALAAAVFSLGLSTAGVKAISEAQGAGDDSEAHTLAAAVLQRPMRIYVCMLPLLLVGARPFSHLVLGPDAPVWYFVAATVGTAGLLVSALLNIVMQGFGLFRVLARVALATAACAIVGNVALIAVFGLRGAVIGLIAAPLINAVGLVATVPLLRSLLLASFHRGDDIPSLHQMRRLSLLTLAVGALALFTDAIVRTTAVHVRGIASAGELFAAINTPAQAFGFINSALAGTTFVALAATARRNSAQAAQLADRTLRLYLTVFVPIVYLLVAMRSLLLTVLFSSDIARTSQAIWSIQMIAETAKASAYIAGAMLLPLGLVRQWGVIGIVTTIANISFGILGLQYIGPQGVPLANACDWCLNLVLTMFLLHRADVRFRSVTLCLILASVVSVGVLVLLSQSPLRPWTGACAGLAGLIWFALNREQLRSVAERIRRRRVQAAS